MINKEAADKFYSKITKEEVDGEIRYFKKREVYPIFDEQGKIKWFNFLTGGKWIKLFTTIILIFIIVGFIYEYSSNLSYCSNVIKEINLIKNMSGINLIP